MASLPQDSSEPEDIVFKALAAPPRRELILLLGQNEASVSELADHFDISRPAISKHLSVLKQADIIGVEKRGRQNIYYLHKEPLRGLVDWLVTLDQFWADHLDDIGERLPRDEGR